jgi:hemoglobin
VGTLSLAGNSNNFFSGVTIMRMRVCAVVVLIVCMAAATGRAQQGSGMDKDKGLDWNSLDNRIVKIVYDAAKLGTDIYNKGQVEGCFRLYQGTLLAVHPLLKEYRQPLAKSVKDKMDLAKTMKFDEGAFLLRAAIDEIQHEIAPGQKAAEKVEKVEKIEKIEANKSLWNRLGGTVAVKKIIRDVVLSATENTKVNLFRGKKLDDKAQDNLKQNLLEFISSVTGGPFPYKGKDMKTAHAGMKITDDEFNELAKIFETVLKANSIAEPDIKEFLGLMETTRKDIVEVKSKN